jgi:DNA polymerase-1
MRHHLWEQAESYPIAILTKATAFNKTELEAAYINPLVSQGVAKDSLIAFTLAYNDQGKAPAAFIKEYLGQLLPVLQDLRCTTLYVADGNYFKVLTGQAKAEPHYGYVLPCKLKGYEHLQIVLGLNYQALIYNPDLQAKLDLSLATLAAHVAGTYQALGTGIIHSASYPEGVEAIAKALEDLHQYPRLSCDIEAFSLRFNEAGIGTIAFAWDQHHGVAFACDYYCYAERPDEGYYGYQQTNQAVRFLLLKFFSTYQGELTFHSAGYDVKVIVYTLWMQHLQDQKGLLTGLDIMTRNLHDTKIIAYLATNSTAGNVLGLKPLAHEFAGNWAKDDIKDIRKIPLKELLQYNLVDCLSTNYVRDKHYPTMVADQQEDLYRGLMLPSLKLIIQMELTGMPMSKQKIAEVRTKLETMRDEHLAVIRGSKLIASLNKLLQRSEWERDYESRKAKAKNPEKILPKDPTAFANVTFNPNSGPQLQKLLYGLMGLPVLDYTDTKLPATGADTIEKLINHTQESEYKELLCALIGYGQVQKILSTFIPAFERGVEKASDGIIWLHGSFNLGGTVSGRLSSSDPNLQNIPANSIFGKVIKECFTAPTGWIFCGADFNSLEDYISALTTRDPNKLNVYIKGFDGHSLRAAYYFRDQLPHIDLEDPKSVNTIKKTHPDLRQDSKPGTFLLTYGGTYHGMMANLGWSEEKSKRIEANYHELYKVSDEYVQKRLQQASKDGYVDVAFGLRVRTPLLKQVVFNSGKVPYEAAAEGRTAGNALGQSYGQLNNRAAVDFWQKVWASPYRYDILPAAMIHDSIYAIVRDDLEVVEWVNRELIKSMQWQELPEIQHDTVKLGSNLDIFWPDWAHPITLPNNADQATILQLCQAAREEFKQAA